eukprot:CCRYP_007230-RA/>CCRYP_007230-RA protein AED:0.00 eAED:0.00 QI:191/1/1/1/1/1/2/168/330
MKFVILKVFAISLVIDISAAHSFKDDSGKSIKEKSSLRGVDIGKVMAGAAIVANQLDSANDRSIGVDAVEAGNVERTRCVFGEEEYFEPDGTIVCKKINLKKAAVVVADDCLPNEEKVIKANGQVICRNVKKGTVVVIDDCLPNEEKIVKANGQVVCRKIKKKSVVVIDNCLPNEERVIKPNGQVVCRKIKNREHTVVVPRKGPRKDKNTKRTRVVSNDDGGTVVVRNDDDSHYVVGRKKKTNPKKVVVAVDDDDASRIVVKPSHRQHSGVVVLDDDDSVIVNPSRYPEPVYGHGKLGPGQDCTNARTSCARGLVCSPSPLNGSDRWTCQ